MSHLVLIFNFILFRSTAIVTFLSQSILHLLFSSKRAHAVVVAWHRHPNPRRSSGGNLRYNSNDLDFLLRYSI